jgi:hypothetical protein
MTVETLRELVAKGEFLLAYDRATTMLDDDPADLEVAYLGVLALARSGATDRAQSQFLALGLDRASARARGSLAEDIDSLFARIAKDQALAAHGGRRASDAGIAARRYEAAFGRHGGAYPCINAATMWLVAGESGRSEELARAALLLASEGGYWDVVTRAEAALLLHAPDDAATLIEGAAQLAPDGFAARATTRRQLRLICDLTGTDTEVLAPLKNPPVMHYAGHRISPNGRRGRFPETEAERVRHEIGTALDAKAPAFAFGSLASGGDILVAESALDRGVELHVVLPFALGDFVRVSVADGGDGWERRFERCIDRATTVSFATDGPHIGDDVPFRLCSSVAMGDALRHARQLEADAFQLAVWDGDETRRSDEAGTSFDVLAWRAAGHRTVIVSTTPDEPRPQAGCRTGRARTLRAVLFADIAGFSTLTDSQMPTFMDGVMRPLATCVDGFGDGVVLRRTWGDGIHLAFESVDLAAACAVALQRSMARIELERLGLPTIRGMRIGAHVGPVYEEIDPFTGQRSYMGANVTRAARVEPGTPEGEVYVTHPFAALAELEGGGRWSCQYVGIVPAAKDHGRLPMYLLRSVAADA